MTARIPVALSVLACVIMFGSIAFVGAMVVISLFTGGIEFPGEPQIADAAGSVQLAA